MNIDIRQTIFVQRYGFTKTIPKDGFPNENFISSNFILRFAHNKLFISLLKYEIAEPIWSKYCQIW